MSDLDPIAGAIGHGSPGLRDGLRPFIELVAETASQKQVFCQVRPAKLCGVPGDVYVPGTGWAIDTVPPKTEGENTYVFPWTETWAGIVRDVVAVLIGRGVAYPRTYRLSRAESKALCDAGSSVDQRYFFDPDVPDSGVRWDDGTTWDSGKLWDQVPLLYAKPGFSPMTGAAVAQALFCYGSDAVAQPTTGTEKLTDGGLETWASASNLTNWTEASFGTGGGAVAQDAGFDGPGTYSAKCSGTLNASGGPGFFQTGMAGLAGKMYRCSGWYKTDADNPATVEARLRVGYGSTFLSSDGRTIAAASAGLTLAATGGYRRRFAFDFVCPGDTSAFEVAVFAWNTAGGTAVGSVWFDGLSLKRIFRFETYESRLALDSIPELEERRPDAFFGTVARAAGTLTLINGNGHFEALLGGLDWINAEVLLLSGGRFVQDGNEVLLEDCWTSLRGVVTAQPGIDDMAAAFPFEDFRIRFAVKVPPRTYEYLGSFMDEDNGRRRPMIFGTVEGLRPTMIATNANGYPYYELCDIYPILVSGGAALKSLDAAYAYEDEEAASKKDTARRVTLVAGDEIVDWSALGELDVSRDVRPRAVTVDGNVIDFNIGAAALEAVVAVGLYHVELASDPSALGLCKRVKDAMNAAAATADIDCTYDEASHKFTISKGAGTLQLLCDTGANKHRAMWLTLGFDPGSDKTGALTYTGDNSTYLSTSDQVVRLDVTGFRDDASGTYTGSASAAVRLAPDVLRYLLDGVCEIEPGVVDVASFNAARSTCVQDLALYLTPPSTDGEELHEVIHRIENGANADLVFENGQLFFRPRSTSIPSDVLEIGERDFLAFSGAFDSEDYFREVRVGYKQNPVSGTFRTTSKASSAVRVRFGTSDQKTFETYYTSETAAKARRDVLSVEASTKRRRFFFRAKGGLFTKSLGAKIQLTRTKGISSTGALSQVLVRIVALRKNLATHETTAEAIEVV